MTAEAATTAPSLLVVDDVRTRFETAHGTVHAVNGVSFSLDAGGTLGIVGESGSGKSVLVRTIMNLLPGAAVVSGDSRIRFDGRDVRRLTTWERRHFWGTEIAMVFQDPMTSLNPVKTIGTQITESMRFHLGLGRRAAEERALDLLGHVRLPSPRRRMDQYPHELSGGMRQRVTIAIALACEPRLLIADEPTTALDVTVQRQILDLLTRVQQEREMAMILITHDLGVVAGYTDRVAVMYGGQIIEKAATDELFTSVRHPYTEALLRSIPRFELPSHSRLAAISGRPPDLRAEPTVCAFAPRCRYVQPDCEAGPVALLSADEPGHLYRCLHPVEMNVLEAGAATRDGTDG